MESGGNASYCEIFLSTGGWMERMLINYNDQVFLMLRQGKNVFPEKHED